MPGPPILVAGRNSPSALSFLKVINRVHKGVLSHLPDKKNALENLTLAKRSKIVFREDEAEYDYLKCNGYVDKK